MSNDSMKTKDLVSADRIDASHVHDWALPNKFGAIVCKECGAQKKD